MSRVGKNPVPIPSGVTVDVKPQEVKSRPEGQPDPPVRNEVKVPSMGQSWSSAAGAAPTGPALHGTTRAHIANDQGRVRGLREARDRRGRLERLAAQEAHPEHRLLPPGQRRDARWSRVETPGPNQIVFRGADCRSARSLRSFGRSVPEPYKGKGTRYDGEYVRARPVRASGPDHVEVPSTLGQQAQEALRLRPACAARSSAPRLSVHRTSKHISVQVIDDVGKTLARLLDRRPWPTAGKTNPSAPP